MLRDVASACKLSVRVNCPKGIDRRYWKSASTIKDFAMLEKYRSRIIIADDHTLIAEACKQLLETEFEVIAIVNNGQALIDSVCRLNPDVALVDISMPLLNGLDACEHIRTIKRTVKIVFLTMNADRAMAAEAFRRGAFGFLPKTAAAAELPIAIRTVIKGETLPLSSHCRRFV